MDLKLYHAITNIVLAMPIGDRPNILFLSPYINCFRIKLNDKTFVFFLIVCLFVCVVDHGVNEGEPVDEQYYEQVCED